MLPRHFTGTPLCFNRAAKSAVSFSVGRRYSAHGKSPAVPLWKSRTGDTAKARRTSHASGNKTIPLNFDACVSFKFTSGMRMQRITVSLPDSSIFLRLETTSARAAPVFSKRRRSSVSFMSYKNRSTHWISSGISADKKRRRSPRRWIYSRPSPPGITRQPLRFGTRARRRRR